MQYFIYDLYLCAFTLHDVESRQYCCQWGLYFSKWKLLPTIYRCVVLRFGLLYAMYCHQWWLYTSFLEKKKKKSICWVSKYWGDRDFPKPLDCKISNVYVLIDNAVYVNMYPYCTVWPKERCYYIKVSYYRSSDTTPKQGRMFATRLLPNHTLLAAAYSNEWGPGLHCRVGQLNVCIASGGWIVLFMSSVLNVGPGQGL